MSYDPRMLELRPTCENCNTPLPPSSLEARICSFECTFCATCAEGALASTCPNCGGGFVPRPVRPARDWKGSNFLGCYPASEKVRHRPVDAATHERLVTALEGVPPHER